MGHYAAEMQCDRCGNLRCTCPPSTDLTEQHWVVTNDFSVMRGIDYEKSCGLILPHYSRMMRKHHPKREDAEAEALAACEAAVEAARTNMLRLKRILKTVRPWEKK